MAPTIDHVRIDAVATGDLRYARLGRQSLFNNLQLFGCSPPSPMLWICALSAPSHVRSLVASKRTHILTRERSTGRRGRPHAYPGQATDGLEDVGRTHGSP